MQPDLVYSNMPKVTLSEPKGRCLPGLESMCQHHPSIIPAWLKGQRILKLVTDIGIYTEEGCAKECQC